jgi:hypothetical protein
LNDTLKAYDFGDAPAPYGTDMLNSGAQHQIISGAPHLGNATDNPDADPDGLWLPPYAWMDDQQFQDDEDGVSFPNFLYAGQNGTITFEVTNGPAYVDGWIDYDLTGIWGDMGGTEHIVTGTYATGIHPVVISVPSTAKRQPNFARFRINSTGTLTPYGFCNDGEVEDHDLRIAVLWLGGTSGFETDWTNPGNWSNGIVPSTTDDVVIPGSISHYPTINGTADCRDLFILDGAQITVTSGANFTIHGDMTVGEGTSGTYTQTGGTCTVVGTTYVKSGGTLIVSGGTFIP